jgi:hypothetical protein
MNHARYMRDRAADFANMALTTSDPVAARSFHEMAMICRAKAEQLERHARDREFAEPR